MILSSTNILGLSHNYPETYEGHGFERHTYRGSDLGLSMATTFSKMVSEAGLIHFLSHAMLSFASGFWVTLMRSFTPPQNFKTMEGKNS